MNISIVIPNYNGKALLEKNLPKMIAAVESYKKGKIEIIISDDGSKDGSVDFLSEFIKKNKEKHVSLQLIDNKVNRGFSVAVDSGARHASGDVIVLLNTDVNPHKGFLDPLVKHFEEDEKVFAVGCMDESIEDGKVVLRGRGVGKWTRGFLMHSAGQLDKTNTLWVSGGSGAFRRSMWEKLGGLNELYTPFYWEDIDLSYRAQKCGYKVLFEKKSVVIHEHSKGSIQTNFKPYNVLKTVFRNQFTFIWINITDGDLFLSHILWMPYHMLKALLRRDRAFFAGLYFALLRLPQVMVYKNNMKKMFIKTDKEIINSVAS